MNLTGVGAAAPRASLFKATDFEGTGMDSAVPAQAEEALTLLWAGRSAAAAGQADSQKSYLALLLQNGLQLHEARDEVTLASILIARMALAKKLVMDHDSRWSTVAWNGPPPHTGKLTMKKVLALMGWWAKHIDDVWP